MKDYHSLLKRQIKRNLKSIDNLPEEFLKFLSSISSAYESLDEDRKLLERSLELSSEELLTVNIELRALLQVLPDLIFIVDSSGIILDCKGGVDSDLLLSRNEYKEKNIIDIPIPQISNEFEKSLAEVVNTKETVSIEYSLELRGEEKFYEAKFLKLDNRQVVIVIKNITERVNTQEVLVRNFKEISKKNIYESIISTVSQSIHNSLNTSDIMELAVESVFKKVESVEFISIFQIEGDDAVLKSHFGYPEWFVEKIRKVKSPKGITWRCIKEKESFHVNSLEENKYLGEAGVKAGIQSYISIPIFLHKKPIGCIHIQSTVKNAFDRNDFNFLGNLCQHIANSINTSLHAKALRESELRYKTLFEQSPDGICIIDKGMKLVHCNESLANIFQSSFEKIIGLDLNNLKDKAFVPVIERAFNGEICTHTTYYEATTSQAKLWLNARLVPIYGNDESEIISVIGVVEDITERKIAETKLKDSESRFRRIVENTTDIIVEASFEGKFLYLSPNATEIMGYEPEELYGTSIFEKLHPDDLAPAIKEFSGTIQDMRHGEMTLRMRTKNGDWKWLEISGRPYYTSDNEIKSIITAHDVTDKKNQEDETIKLQKLESLSILAGGIAHDFNNILTVVISNLSLAEMHLEGNSEVNEMINSAQRASLRASDLTNQLRTFAKGSSMIKQPMLLNTFLDKSVKFALMGSNVTNELNFTNDVEVDIDENQISQVINNLIINAKQAMPNGGHLKVITDQVKIDEDTGLSLDAGDYIKLSIIDEGVGIKSKNLNKIFDPYFTTKEKGSGLGLATSYSIILKHDGLITVNSALGEGTECNVYLPCKPGNNNKENKLGESKELKGSGRLLLMDDEEGIVDTLSLMLSKIGYDVDSVKNGEEAIQAYDKAIESNNSYSAVILDLTIPGGMGGAETVQRLKQIDPDAYCIVSSGYSADPVIEQYREFGFSDCLNKPFSIKNLKEVLNKIKEFHAG